MTARERLMAALVKSELSYEQLPEDDVARVLAADPGLEADLEDAPKLREDVERLREALLDAYEVVLGVSEALSGLVVELKPETRATVESLLPSADDVLGILAELAP